MATTAEDSRAAPALAVDVGTDRGRPYRIAGLVSAGAGVALVGTGVYFGLKAKSASSDLDALQGGWDQGLYDSGQAAQRNMYVCLGAGGAAIAGGAILYFILGRHDVTVSPAPAGVVISGRY